MANEKKNELEIVEIYGYTTKAFNQQVKNNESALMRIFDLSLTEKKSRT